MASLWIGSGAGWPLKGLGLASPNYQVGAHFEALFKGVLMAASKSIETFLPFPELQSKSGQIVDCGHFEKKIPTRALRALVRPFLLCNLI